MLSAQQIECLKARRQRYSVRAGRGLVLRVHPGGTKTWALRQRLHGRDENVTLGRWPEMSRKSAEQHAARVRKLAARGESPSARRWRRRMGLSFTSDVETVESFAGRYLREIAAKKRKDLKPVERYLKRDIYPAIGKLRIAEVEPEDIQELVFRRRDAGRPAAAGALRDLLDRIFKYAKVCRLRADNPVEATPAAFVYQARGRERSLGAGELKAVFSKMADPRLGRVYALMLDLLLLTLTRKSELRQARREHIDLGAAVWEIPAELSKNGKAHVVFLSRQAVERFRALERLFAESRNPHIIPGRMSDTLPLSANALNRAMARVKWKIPRFTVHDLRRTASTLLNDMDYDDDWIEAALNHVRGGIRGVYNKARYAKQRRQMLQEWADYLDTLRDQDQRKIFG